MTIINRTRQLAGLTEQVLNEKVYGKLYCVIDMGNFSNLEEDAVEAVKLFAHQNEAIYYLLNRCAEISEFKLTDVFFKFTKLERLVENNDFHDVMEYLDSQYKEISDFIFSTFMIRVNLYDMINREFIFFTPEIIE
jgi:hypothetical protein